MEIPANLFATRLVAEGKIPDGYVHESRPVETDNTENAAPPERLSGDEQIKGGLGGRVLRPWELEKQKRLEERDRERMFNLREFGTETPDLYPAPAKEAPVKKEEDDLQGSLF
jgi:hypothetical protein